MEISLAGAAKSTEDGVTVYTVPVAVNQTVTVLSEAGCNRVEILNTIGRAINVNNFGTQMENIGSDLPLSFGWAGRSRVSRLNLRFD